ITIKDEPEDDSPSVVVASNHTPLPSISEENWRAYYQPSLVVYNGIPEDQISVYEAATGYKLPPLGKFGKNLVGKLPASAIWRTAFEQCCIHLRLVFVTSCYSLVSLCIIFLNELFPRKHDVIDTSRATIPSGMEHLSSLVVTVTFSVLLHLTIVMAAAMSSDAN
ncbi:hypothetical protein AVEN_253083-1, partial [Araneus ventricosus]